jgi:AraC-like DNA-binding protein
LERRSSKRPGFLLKTSGHNRSTTALLLNGRWYQYTYNQTTAQKREMPRPLKFDSSLLKPGDAEELWRESLKPIYEIGRRKDAEFQAQIQTWDMGGAMALTQHAARDEVQFKRTRRKIALSGVDHYLVHCLLGGQLVSQFADGQQSVPVSSLAVRDMAVENTGFALDAPMFTLSIPRLALDRRLPPGARLHGVCFDASDPVGALAASHIHTLARFLTDMDVDQARTAAHATLDLLAACVLPKVTWVEDRDDGRLTPALRAQALSHIEQHLLDPDLTPESVQGALRVSRTVLYDMFQELGGVASLIRGKRLDEAMRRLADPRHARERVSEIAYSTGFSNEKTFGRAFKERFGCSPGEVREQGNGMQIEAAKTAEEAQSLAAEYDAILRRLRG